MALGQASRSFSSRRMIMRSQQPQVVFRRANSYNLRMIKRPLVLVSPNVEKKGDEFGDLSTSLSETYQQALMGAGGIPLALPATVSRKLITECVSRCDGVLLTGGEDVEPRRYANELPRRLRKQVIVT